MTFEEMYKIDVSKHVEKKGRFSYLSWPYAVAELSKADPTSSWVVSKFDGVPFLKTDCGTFVEVSVMFNGNTRTQIHPVLNGQNRPIDNPNCFDINTSIQRCLVKAIALHGLGLYIYAGEDLPEEEAQKKQKKATDRPEYTEEMVVKNAPAWREKNRNAEAIIAMIKTRFEISEKIKQLIYSSLEEK